MDKKQYKAYLIRDFELDLVGHKQYRSQSNVNYSDFEPNVEFKSKIKKFAKYKEIYIKDLQIKKCSFNKCKLLCKVISSEPMLLLQMILLVEDQQNNVSRLSVQNYQNVFTQKELIKNTKIIVLNPQYNIAIDGIPLILIDNPYDIIIDNNENQQKNQELQKKFKEIITVENPAEDYKNLGNLEFQNSNYNKAIDLYSKAIQLDSNQSIYYGNRAQAYLDIKKYKKAIQDAESAIKLNPDNAKFYFRKALALMEKCQYAAADQFLKEKNFSSTNQLGQEIKSLHQTIKRLIANTEGKYDFTEILNEQNNKDYQIEEFIGPIKHVLNQNNQKVIIATRDLQQGELILVTKAFSISKQLGSDETEQINPLAIDFNNPTKIIQESFSSYMISIQNSENSEKKVKLMLSNSTAENLNDLKLSCKLKKHLFPKVTLEMKEQQTFYQNHIIQCENLSCFQCKQKIPIIQKSNTVQAIFLIAPLIRHFCAANSSAFFLNPNLLIIKALKNIPKNSEITCSFMNRQSYELNHNMVKQNQPIICGCKICKFETYLNDEDRKLLSQFYLNVTKSYSDYISNEIQTSQKEIDNYYQIALVFIQKFKIILPDIIEAFLYIDILAYFQGLSETKDYIKLHNFLMKYIDKKKFDWKEYLKYFLIRIQKEKKQKKKKQRLQEMQLFIEKYLGFSSEFTNKYFTNLY